VALSAIMTIKAKVINFIDITGLKFDNEGGDVLPKRRSTFPRLHGVISYKPKDEEEKSPLSRGRYREESRYSDGLCAGWPGIDPL
jgi:hypothetical protein